MQDILIHVRDFRTHTPAAGYGVRLAAAIGASVTGAHVCPVPAYVVPAYGPGGIATAVMEDARRLINDAVEAKSSFVDWAVSLGVARATWLVAEGDTSDALTQVATRHDLLVLDHVDEERTSPPRDIARLILRTGVPCIVVPHHGARFQGFGRIAIGWNGSPEAMRAVHSALPFLRGKQVLLLRGEERPVLAGVAWTPPFDIVEYLVRHDVTVEERGIFETREDAGGVLLEEALEYEADLFVMGAYGRSRFSEWMLGGATRYALTWADIPVLLQH